MNLHAVMSVIACAVGKVNLPFLLGLADPAL